MTWTLFISILAFVSLPCHLAYRIERQAVTEALEVEPTEALEQEWPITQPSIVTTPPAFFQHINNIGSPSGIRGNQGAQAGPNAWPAQVPGSSGPVRAPGTAIVGQPAQGTRPVAPAGETPEVETPEGEVPVSNPPTPPPAGQIAGGNFDPLFGFLIEPTTPGWLNFYDLFYPTTAGPVFDQSIAIAPGRPGLTGPDPVVIGDILGPSNNPQQRTNAVDVTGAISQGSATPGQYYQPEPMGVPLSNTNSLTGSRINLPQTNNVGAAEFLPINTNRGPQYRQGPISSRNDGVAIDYQSSIQGQTSSPNSSNSQGIQQAGPAQSQQGKGLVSNGNQGPRGVQSNVASSGPVPYNSGTAYTQNVNVVQPAGYAPTNNTSATNVGRQSTGPISNNSPVPPSQVKLTSSSGNVASGQLDAVAGNSATSQGEIIRSGQGNPAPGNLPLASVDTQPTTSAPQSNAANQNSQASQSSPTSQVSNQTSQTNQGSGDTNNGTTPDSYQGHWVFEAARTSNSGPGPIRGQWVFQTASGTPSSGPAPITGQWVFEPEAGAVRNGTNPIRGQWVFKPDLVQNNATSAAANSGPRSVDAGPSPQKQPTTAILPENTVPPQVTQTAQPPAASQGVIQGNSNSTQGTIISAGNAVNVTEQPVPTPGSSGIRIQGQGSISISNQIPLSRANLSISVYQPAAVDIPTATTSSPLIATTEGVPTTVAITTPAPVTEALDIEPTEALEVEPTQAPEVPPAPAATVPPTILPGATQPTNAATANQTSSPVGSGKQPVPTNGSAGQGNVVEVQPLEVVHVPNGPPQPQLTAGEVQPSTVAVVEQQPLLNPTGGQQTVNVTQSEAVQVPIVNAQSVVPATNASAASSSPEPVVWPQAGPVTPL